MLGGTGDWPPRRAEALLADQVFDDGARSLGRTRFRGTIVAMKTNPVKRKLRAGEPVFGTWLTLDNLHTARVLARAGFDWLTLDLEHSAIDWSQAAAVFAMVADGGGVPPGPGAGGEPPPHQRVLDAGAWGSSYPWSIPWSRPGGHRGGQVSPQVAAPAADERPRLWGSADEYFQRANDDFSWSSRPKVRPAWRTPRRSTACPAATRFRRARGPEVHYARPTDATRRPRSTKPWSSGVTWPSSVGTPTGIHCFEPEGSCPGPAGNAVSGRERPPHAYHACRGGCPHPVSERRADRVLAILRACPGGPRRDQATIAVAP